MATEKDAHLIMESVGLEIEQWLTKTQESIEFFEQVAAKIEIDGPPPLGIHLLMGDNAKEKLENQAKNLNEGRVSIALGMACKK